jgi:hypothetical protein
VAWKLLLIVGALVVVSIYAFVLWRGAHGLVNRDGSHVTRTQWRHIGVLIGSGAVLVGVTEGLAVGLHLASDTPTSIVAGAAIGAGVWFVVAFVWLASGAVRRGRTAK